MMIPSFEITAETPSSVRRRQGHRALARVGAALSRLGRIAGNAMLVLVTGLVLALGAALLGTWRLLVWMYHRTGESKRTILGLLGVSLGVFWAQLRYPALWGGDYSIYGSMLVAASLLCAFFYTLVRYGHAKLDPIGQLRERNTAVALYFLGYALLVVAAVLAFRP